MNESNRIIISWFLLVDIFYMCTQLLFSATKWQPTKGFRDIQDLKCPGIIGTLLGINGTPKLAGVYASSVYLDKPVCCIAPVLADSVRTENM